MPRSNSLADDLATHRQEALDQLLTLSDQFVPELYREVARLSDALRGKTMAREDVFREAGALYVRLVDARLDQAKEVVVAERRELAALKDVGDLVKLVQPDTFENELLGHRAALNDLAHSERNHLITAQEASVARAAIRSRALQTFDAIRESIRTEVEEVAPGGLAAAAPAGVAAATAVSAPPTVGAPPAVVGAVAPAADDVVGEHDDAVLSCNGIRKRFKTSRADVLSGITLRVRSGRILGIVGLNGAGKTTLLRILAGDLKPDGEKVVTRLKRSDIALVPQRPEEWTGTLTEHLRLHAAYHGFRGARNEENIEKTLRILDLQTFRGHRFHELSAGYQMRCALAQALVGEPLLLLLDEPLAPLDVVAQYRFLHSLHLHATHTKRRLPVVVSSQHIELIEDVADDLLVLRDGKAVFCGERALVGQGRTGTIIVVRSRASRATISEAVVHLAPRDQVFRAGQNAEQLHVLHFEQATPIEQVQSALRDKAVPHTMVADVTRSTLALLLSEEAIG